MRSEARAPQKAARQRIVGGGASLLRGDDRQLLRDDVAEQDVEVRLFGFCWVIEREIVADFRRGFEMLVRFEENEKRRARRLQSDLAMLSSHSARRPTVVASEREER